MADPPPIRRPGTKPPPIPNYRSPLSSVTAKTDVVQAHGDGDEISEITRNVEAPDAGALVERMLEMVASEAEALLAGDDDGRLADLNVRTALASWDALHQSDEAMRFLELADRHPLAPRLRFAAALVAGDLDALTAAEKRIGDDNGALAIELADAWMWRHGRADKAAPIADRLLGVKQLPPAWRFHVIELAALAHAVLGNWARVVEIRRAELTVASPPEEVAATAAMLLDRSKDAAGALSVCWAKLEHYPGVGNLDHAELGWLRTFDIAITAATILDDERRYEILDKRAELVASFSGGAAETLATRHAVGAELERDRQHVQALALWMQLAEEPAAQLPNIAKRIAYLRAAWSAAGANDRQMALGAHRRLAGDPASLEVAATHAWRALELAAALGDPSVSDLARAVVDTVDSIVAERWLDGIELPSPNAATMVRFEERGGLFLRWAATIAERRGEPAKAAQLWQRATADDALPTTRDHLVRLFRNTDEDQLAEAYAAAAKAETDARSAAALWCARGIVDLARGDFIEAEDSLRHAADLGPKDPFCRAALAAVYRAGKDHQQLARMLSELSTSLTSKDGRAQAAREHAELLDELGDPAGARAALERLISERPDDGNAMLTLARLCDRDELWARAIELRRKAAELVPPAKMGDIWIEIALGEERRGDEKAALVALERAAETKHPDALREQARLHRQAGRLDKALEIVRAELATDPVIGRRMQLQTELARTLTELGTEPEAVVAAYLDVLSVEPDQTEALIMIEEPARALGMWDELARAFRGAPQTPQNVEVLAEALAKIAEWSELAEVRRKQLEAATAPAEKAQRAGELANLYEHELGDTEAAIRMLLIAQAAQHDDKRQQDLLRLLRDAQRWTELVVVLERELPTIKPSDITRQIDVLLELGDLRGDRLGRQADAIAAYEGVLALRPDDPTAAKALESLYEQTGRDRELARILETRAEGTTDKPARAQLFARVATLRSNRGDVDGALAAYTAAFAADPTNRDVFTAMERVCYKAERWAAAMQLYESAIQHVEAGISRAYRLGDLYSRRGNVQLNFLGQVESAVESYQKVVEVDSQPAAAVKVLETLCIQRNDWQPLIDAYERRAETQKDPTRKTDALRSAAKLSAEHASDARHSMRLQRKLLTVDPKDVGAAATLERYYEDAQDKSGLIDVLKMRLTQAQGKAESVELLKKIARASEDGARDVDMATEHYMKILELQPENRDALDALGRIYESTEQWAEFIDVTRKLIKVTNDRNTKALLYFRCGSVMEAKFGREQDAIRYYDAAIKTSSACLPAVHGLRDLYRRREEWPRVIETLELEVKLWQDDKERAGVFAQIGRIFDKQLGDPEKAMTYYESALTVDPECLPANQSLFEHYFEIENWDKAQPLANSLAQKAMREGDPSTRSDFYRRRGVVAKHTGD
nr:tetratricopeptide repeat protein [Deltaproteobacteria bacterium]